MNMVEEKIEKIKKSLERINLKYEYPGVYNDVCNELDNIQNAYNNCSKNVPQEDILHLKSSKKNQCFICKKFTDRVDVISKAYLCSNKCEEEFYKKVSLLENK